MRVFPYISYTFTPYGKNAQNKGINTYRFLFNGQERDDEVYGDANAYDFEMRTYDPRIGRFLSIDPLFKDFAGLSNYSFAKNSPIYLIDYLGLAGWPATNKAEDVMSVSDFQRFCVTEIQVLQANKVNFDCADLSLYLVARYYQARGVELKYVHPISGREISSSDDDFKTFDEFAWGVADGGKANTGKYRGDLHDGFLGAFGTSQIGQISTEIPFEQIGVGDFYNTGVHVSVAVPNAGFAPDESYDPYAVVSGSGTYTGGGLRSEMPGRPPKLGVIAGPSEGRTLSRFDFLFNIPTTPKGITIDVIGATPISTGSTEFKLSTPKKLE